MEYSRETPPLAVGRRVRWLSRGTVILGVALGAGTYGLLYYIVGHPDLPLEYHLFWSPIYIMASTATALFVAGYMFLADLLFQRKLWLAIIIVWLPTMGSMAWLVCICVYRAIYPSPDMYQPGYHQVIFFTAVMEISFVLFWLTVPLGALAGVFANEDRTTQSSIHNERAGIPDRFLGQ